MSVEVCLLVSLPQFNLSDLKREYPTNRNYGARPRRQSGPRGIPLADTTLCFCGEDGVVEPCAHTTPV